MQSWFTSKLILPALKKLAHISIRPMNLPSAATVHRPQSRNNTVMDLSWFFRWQTAPK
jgi:hypothetical protein